MQEEKRRVLEMVAAGKVSPQEAGVLLDALGREESVAPARSGGGFRWLGVNRLPRSPKRAIPEE